MSGVHIRFPNGMVGIMSDLLRVSLDSAPEVHYKRVGVPCDFNVVGLMLLWTRQQGSHASQERLTEASHIAQSFPDEWGDGSFSPCVRIWRFHRFPFQGYGIPWYPKHFTATPPTSSPRTQGRQYPLNLYLPCVLPGVRRSGDSVPDGASWN